MRVVRAIAMDIVCRNKAEARKISTALLKKHLAVCTNMWSIESRYRWKGKIANSREVVLIAKTQAKHYAKVVKLVASMHSYKVPCIGKSHMRYNQPYASWLISET